ncbi:MAG: GNAT family N-acetyltransferase [Acetobacteraceae bacterium]|nr:GNAT family N-acetyltransferase [Acetobacteraceae bacterium]
MAGLDPAIHPQADLQVRPVTAIRPANPSDTPAILRLIRGLAEYERKLHQAIATEAEIHALLFGPRPHAFAALAEENSAAVGLILWYYTVGTFSGRLGLFVEDVFVEPPHRGKGIGLALFRHVAAVARTENCICMEWRVLHWNQSAIDFYRRLGATPLTEWQTMDLRGDALTALAEGTRDG